MDARRSAGPGALELELDAARLVGERLVGVVVRDRGAGRAGIPVVAAQNDAAAS